MFEKTGTRILGVVENMSYFADPSTGARIPIFGTGGARAEAERLGARVLGELPLEIAVREGGDNGAPVVAAAPDSAAAKVFLAMAQALAE
jgi:ATP-binding protein involved in chromosome partitioning